jgi:hypothetical protein
MEVGRGGEATSARTGPLPGAQGHQYPFARPFQRGCDPQAAPAVRGRPAAAQRPPRVGVPAHEERRPRPSGVVVTACDA